MTAGLIVKMDGSVEEIAKADYDTLRAGVGGGWLQAITLVGDLEGVVMYIDEEGKMKGLMSNLAATTIARQTIYAWDYIVGDAVFAGKVKLGGHHSPLTPEEAALIRKFASDLKI